MGKKKPDESESPKGMSELSTKLNQRVNFISLFKEPSLKIESKPNSEAFSHSSVTPLMVHLFFLSMLEYS